MSDRHDEEIEHYRARVDQIPERPEASPERAAMTDEEIQSIQRSLDFFRNGGFVPTSFLAEMAYNATAEVTHQRSVIAERDATIEDRQWEIDRLVDWLNHWNLRLRNLPPGMMSDIERALAGEAAPS